MSYSTTDLIKKLEALGLSPKKALGQNFLVSDAVIKKICDCALSFEAPIIEIGPGLGALTEHLSVLQKDYEVIELDRAFAKMWADRGLIVHEVDALKQDWNLFENKPARILVSNLPYQISASIVIDRCLDNPSFKGMVLMFQKEVAARITAKQGTDDYGLLTVIAQNFWKPEVVTEAGPKDFYPPPRVASRVLKFTPLKTEEFDREKFLGFVKVGFAHRRKLLSSNLTAWKNLQKSEVEKALVSIGKIATARAEELSPKDFLSLFKVLEGL